MAGPPAGAISTQATAAPSCRVSGGTVNGGTRIPTITIAIPTDGLTAGNKRLLGEATPGRERSDLAVINRDLHHRLTCRPRRAEPEANHYRPVRNTRKVHHPLSQAFGCCTRFAPTECLTIGRDLGKGEAGQRASTRPRRPPRFGAQA